MGTRLLQVITFPNVAPAAVVALPHTLNIAGTPITPDFVASDVSGFTIAATSTTVTVTNNGTAPATINVWLERKHSEIRQLGGGVDNLTPQPFVAASGSSGGGGGSTFPAPATSFDYFEDFMGGADPTTYHVVVTGGATSQLATSQLPFIGVLNLSINNTNDKIYAYVGKNQIQLEETLFTKMHIEWGAACDLFGNQGSFCARLLANSNMVPTLVGGNGNCLSFALGDDQNGNANWWGILDDATRVDLGVANDTNYHRFRVEWTVGVGVEWFIDGVSVGTAAGNPSVAGQSVFVGGNQVAGVVGFAPSLTMDYVWIHMDLNRP